MAVPKTTSGMLQVSFHIDESGANTFTSTVLDLQLNPLDQEVLMIYAVDFDTGNPDGIAGTDTDVTVSVSTTARTTVGRLDSSNVLAAEAKSIRAGGFVDAGVGFTTEMPSSPVSAGLAYIGILATSDLHIQIEGVGNNGPMFSNGRVYCQRAKATSSVYAALVASEALSQ